MRRWSKAERSLLESQGCALHLEFGHFEFTTAPNLITALPRGRGYGEAGGEGLFSSVTISESLTPRFAVPPLPQAGEGCHPLLISRSDQMSKLESQGCALRQPGNHVRPEISVGRCGLASGQSLLRNVGFVHRSQGRVTDIIFGL